MLGYPKSNPEPNPNQVTFPCTYGETRCYGGVLHNAVVDTCENVHQAAISNTYMYKQSRLQHVMPAAYLHSIWHVPHRSLHDRIYVLRLVIKQKLQNPVIGNSVFWLSR